MGRWPRPQVSSLTNTLLEQQPWGPSPALKLTSKFTKGKQAWADETLGNFMPLTAQIISGKAAASLDRGPIPAQHPKIPPAQCSPLILSPRVH